MEKSSSVPVLCCLVLACCFRVSYSYKVLFFNGMGEGSHYTAASAIGEALVERDISVTFVISDTFISRSTHPLHSKLFDFEVIPTGKSKEEVEKRFEPLAINVLKGGSLQGSIQCLADILKELSADCESLFQPDVISRFNRHDFDMIVYDPAWPCTALLAEYLNITKVSFIPPALVAGFLRFHGNPLNPAIVAESGFGLPVKMSFINKVQNVALIIIHEIFLTQRSELDNIRERFNINKSWKESLETTSFVLASSDPIIDQRIPVMPNVALVGGVTTNPSNPLSDDLEEFMQSSGDHGVIIFALGSYVSHLPDDLVKLFQDAFSKLPQKVIWQWKNKAEATDMPESVKTMSWLPQNDLLGHNKTRLFFYQGGNNGLYEAIYHAVPLLVMPLFGDQPDVAQRVVEREVGLKLDVTKITSESVVEAIMTILTDEKYQKNVKVISEIFRDRPDTPRERAAFWIEHVLKHGADHLRSPVHDLNFIQLNLWDVYGFLLLCVSLVLYIVYRVGRLVFGCFFKSCCGKKSKTD
ncbi:UDP-glucuronosyltransferase 2A3-like [Apostichopus japonicus]|uniref:UDP-glucuronosyltransferase 2A3-like n=1 Tax=Stichopus japonicus TaxID=307972 RepID=UPI003AB1EF54